MSSRAGLLVMLSVTAACGDDGGSKHDIDAAVAGDAAVEDAPVADAAADDAVTGDGSTTDAATTDAPTTDAPPADALTADAMVDASPVGPITGGPCLSGAPGATAFRARWLGSTGQSAYPQYEVNGLPDHSRSRIGAYGYQIGFTPQYADPFLGDGGLQLDGSSFIDIELSTVGLASIEHATLALYGRSYNTTASGSFNWMTFDGFGQTPTNSVSNVAPYHWDTGDMTTEITPGDDGVLIRIKAGPSSGSLVVNRVELCLQAH